MGKRAYFFPIRQWYSEMKKTKKNDQKSTIFNENYDANQNSRIFVVITKGPVEYISKQKIGSDKCRKLATLSRAKLDHYGFFSPPLCFFFENNDFFSPPLEK